jgi:dethiobiotin synthetase
MSLNSAVTADGAEIGRAQAMQAAAARVAPEAAMNPVLLKPGSDQTSQVVVLGKPWADVSAMSYRQHKAELLEISLSCLADLRSRFDVVVCEGAGSPAEINLRATDIANMGLARAAGLPVLVVGDINPGGVFAALFGTLALLSPQDQALVCGFVVNKFRGDVALLEPGLEMLQTLTGRRTYGVLPWTEGLELDVEDSLGLSAAVAPVPPRGGDVLRVSVVRLPRLSNWTDVDALRSEPGLLVRFATTPEELADADLVVVPGTRATVADLAWLRRRGLDVVLARRAAEGRPVLGICGGYQRCSAGRRGRTARTRSRRRTRSTTGSSPSTAGSRCSRRGRGPVARGAGSAPCSARSGTARSSPTAPAVPCCRRSPPRSGATGGRGRWRSRTSGRHGSTRSATSWPTTSTPAPSVRCWRTGPPPGCPSSLRAPPDAPPPRSNRADPGRILTVRAGWWVVCRLSRPWRPPPCSPGRARPRRAPRRRGRPRRRRSPAPSRRSRRRRPAP